MSREIDLGLLEKSGACAEGTEWFKTFFAGGATSFEEGLAALQDQGRTDYMAWIFFHVPFLRRMSDPALRVQVMGPRHEALAALVDGLRKFPWLSGEPDASIDLQALVDSHLRRLSRFGFVPASLAVPVRRVSMSVAFARLAPSLLAGASDVDPAWPLAWRNALLAAESTRSIHAIRAARRAVERLRKAVDEGRTVVPAPPGQWQQAHVAAEAAVAERLAGREPVARQTRGAAEDAAGLSLFPRSRALFGAASDGPSWNAALLAAGPQDPPDSPCPAVVFRAARLVADRARRDAANEAAWLLADVPLPSPFAPLVALWQQGLWPAGVAGTSFWIGDPSLDARGSEP